MVSLGIPMGLGGYDTRAITVQGAINAQKAEAVHKNGRKEVDPAAWFSK